MDALNVLLVARDTGGAPSGLDRTGDASTRFRWTRTSAVHSALSQLEEGKFDAIVCVVDRADELAVVVRVRKIDSRTPLLLITESEDSDVARWGRALGATDVATRSSAPDVIAARLQQIVELRRLAKDIRVHSGRALDLSKDVATLARHAKELAEQARRTAAAGSVLAEFHPLLVEDNKDQVFLLLEAFSKARVPSPSDVLVDGDEAIAYLSGQGAYSDRRRHPIPSLVILDVHLPKRNGFEVLDWIRSRRRFDELPVVVLSSSSSPEDMNRARRLRANLYLAKPANLEALVQTVQAIAGYWLISTPRGTFR